jgi:diacylglycerol kinase (ATP)
MTAKRAKLIVNPKAGLSRKPQNSLSRVGSAHLAGPQSPAGLELVHTVERQCRKARMTLDVEFTQYPGHAIEIASRARDRFDLVIAAGGDGTVNEVINGIARSRTALAIVPFGTVNVMALELGIPGDVHEAAQLISSKSTVSIDLGLAKMAGRSRYFSLALGVGFDAMVIQDANCDFRERWGGLGYLMVGGKNLLTYKWPRINVRHGLTSTGYFVIVANSRRVWGANEMADRATMTDGLLDLVVINRKNWHALDLLLALSSAKLKRYLRKEYHQVKEVEIFSDSEVAVQADGEIIGKAPVKVKVVPRALRVLANPSNFGPSLATRLNSPGPTASEVEMAGLSVPRS